MNWREWFHNYYKWVALYIMVGIIMYWSVIVIQPVIQILNNQNEFIVNNSRQLHNNIIVAKWILGNISAIDITQNITNIENQLEYLVNLTNSTN